MADSAPRVSIVFCGGCNPRIDRGLVAGDIARRLAAHGYRVAYNERDADLLVRLSGCTSGCAGRDIPAEIPPVPVIAVAAESVDAVAVPEEDLAAAVVAKAAKYLRLK